MSRHKEPSNTIIMYGMPPWSPGLPDPWDAFKPAPILPFVVPTPQIIPNIVLPPATPEHSAKELALMDEITRLRVEVSRLQKALRILAGEEP